MGLQNKVTLDHKIEGPDNVLLKKNEEYSNSQ
jgi:hypothetical protein